MKSLINWIKKYTIYETDLRHRFMNIVLIVGMLTVPFCVILDAYLGTAKGSYKLMIVIFLLFLFSFMVANAFKKPRAASILLSVVATDFVVPFLFFRDGGAESGMPIWFVFASLFACVLVDGWACVLILITNMIMYGAAYYLEYRHPEYVTRLADTSLTYTDTLISTFVVIFVFSLIFKFQTRLYENKKKELEDKEEELSRINERLKRSSESKSIFLASMSHEIRTPINAILGMNEMILRESKEDNTLEYADSIENASGTLLTLVNDILDFTKIESGLMEILPDEFDLFSVLNDCYNLLLMRAKDKGLKMELKNNPLVPGRLYADEVRIRQVITNLLTNAVKYTDEGSIIVNVDFVPENGENDDKDGKYIKLLISVKDTGRGISKEGMKDLFDRFKRVDEKKNKNIEGTGLGLAIAKQLTNLMGGTIDVRSKEGEGSEFTASFVVKAVSEEGMGDFSERYKERSVKGSEYKVSFKAPDARILIVDDVKINLKVISMLLKQTEVKIDKASSGKECLKLYENEHYDLILLDHMMPEMDGIETLKRLKETDRYKNESTPVIALTANATLGAEKIYLDTGFDGYLTKPVTGEDIEKTVLNYIKDKAVLLDE